MLLFVQVLENATMAGGKGEAIGDPYWGGGVRFGVWGSEGEKCLKAGVGEG